MIHYERRSWWHQLLIYRGGVFSLVLRGFLLYASYTMLRYLLCLHCWGGATLRDEGRSVQFFGGFVSFLQIWRLNQCYARYERGKECTSSFFSALHSIAGVACGYLRGADLDTISHFGQPQDGNRHLEQDKYLDGLATAMRVNIVRLVLAIAIAFKYHCRIAENMLLGAVLSEEQLLGVHFDFLRLEGLLYAPEHAVLREAYGLYVEALQSQAKQDGLHSSRSPSVLLLEGFQQTHPPRSFEASISLASGGLTSEAFGGSLVLGSASSRQRRMRSCPLLVVLIQLLRDVIAQPMNHKWGYPERIVNVLEAHLRDVARTFEQLDRLITMPLPLAYLQHCKFLFLSFCLSYPLTIDPAHGMWANVISPCLIFVALFGFEVLADELENPIGDDMVDLNTMRMINELEGRLEQIFAVSQGTRRKLRKALQKPLEHLGFHPKEATTDVSAPTTTGFSTHFQWLPMPAHIIAYCGEKERGIGEELLYEAGLTPAGRGVLCRPCFRWGESGEVLVAEPDIDEQRLLEKARALNLTTHFVCLRSEQERTQRLSQEQLGHYLAAREASHSANLSSSLPTDYMPVL